jgi:hypothetical protein
MSHLNNEADFEPDFGIKKFHSKKFENSDDDAINVTNPIESKGIERAFNAFCQAISAKDCFSEESNE